MPGINDAPGPGRARARGLCRGRRDVTSAGSRLHLRGEVRELFIDWLRAHRPDLVPRYERLYRRGAYAPQAERQRLARLARRPGRAAAIPAGRSAPEGLAAERARRPRASDAAASRARRPLRPTRPEPVQPLFHDLSETPGEPRSARARGTRPTARETGEVRDVSSTDDGKRKSRLGPGRMFQTRSHAWEQVGLAGSSACRRRAARGAARRSSSRCSSACSRSTSTATTLRQGSPARPDRHGHRAGRPRLGLRARHRSRVRADLFRRMDPATAGTFGFLIRLVTVGLTLIVALRIAGVQQRDPGDLQRGHCGHFRPRRPADARQPDRRHRPAQRAALPRR